MGNIYSTYLLAFPPKSLFTVDQIPDLTGQVIISLGKSDECHYLPLIDVDIRSGNTGIGKETCKALLDKNARVYLAARDKSKADEAIESLKAETNGKAPTFLDKEQELHVLFNNAGVMTPPVEQRTADGYDLQFGTNVLGHFFLTTLLLPTLIHTAKNSPVADGHVRVVNISSMAALWASKGGIVWETLGTDATSEEACRKLGTSRLYIHSKLGNVLFSNELAKRYREQGVLSYSVHPGVIQSGLFRHLPAIIAKLYTLPFYPTNQGALTQLWAGTVPEGLDHSGKYLVPWARVGDMPPGAQDGELAEKLSVWMEEQVKGH